MALLWTALALTVSLSSLPPSGCIEAGPNEEMLAARDALVTAALNLRMARLDRESAEAFLDEVDSRVEAARIQIEKDLEQGTGNRNAEALKAATERRRQALSVLEARDARVGRAEERLRRAEQALATAERRTTKGPG
jgi:hypothetical protein